MLAYSVTDGDGMTSRARCARGDAGDGRRTALVIGRFQEASQVPRSLLEQIIARQDRLADLPVLANVDFGHTDPRITFPVGGRAVLAVGANTSPRIADS